MTSARDPEVTYAAGSRRRSETGPLRKAPKGRQKSHRSAFVPGGPLNLDDATGGDLLWRATYAGGWLARLVQPQLRTFSQLSRTK